MRMLTAAPAITLLLCITACTRLSTERSYAVVGNTSAAVRTAFNADAGKVRVVMVVSPTCGACLEGASEVSQQVAGINQGKTVPLYVLWVPRRGGQEKDVRNATRLIADASAHEFWDGNNLSGVQYRQVLGWRGNAWDVYMVYGPKAQWSGDLPPVPDFFMAPDFREGAATRCGGLRNEAETTSVRSPSAGHTPNGFDWNRQRYAVERGELLRSAARPRQSRQVSLHRLVFTKNGERFAQNADGASVLWHDDLVMHPFPVAARSDNAGAPQVGKMP